MPGRRSKVEALLERLITQVRHLRWHVAKFNELIDEVIALVEDVSPSARKLVRTARKIVKAILHVLPYAIGLIMYLRR